MKDKNQGKNIALIGTQSSTINCLQGLTREGYKINNIITLPPSLKTGVADYQDLSFLASKENIPYTQISNYGMKDDNTRDILFKIPIDAAIVVGWQRLIPTWLLERIPLGTYGMHGSALPLPKGRGRSPLNWSILENKDRFYTYLFRYDPGVDSGDIVDVQRFDIRPWDTIQSLQHKNTVSQYLLLLKHLPAILSGKISCKSQNISVSPSYYPKRSPDDGAINWLEWTAMEIFSLIRAVTRPYPGAFTKHEETTIYIWEGVPFDSQIIFPGATPGEIVEVFSDGTFLVQSFVDTIHVLDYSSDKGWKPVIGAKFKSLPNQSWTKLATMKLEEHHG
jgi:methionyl-tRNA formyltransferase